MTERVANWRRGRRIRAGCATAALALALGGCSAFSSMTDSLFGGEKASDQAAEPADVEGAVKPATYYIAVEDVPLYAEPGRTVVARLKLHQKVVRYRVVRGYAFVKVDGTDQEGWLDNAKLIWRLPAKENGSAEQSAPGPDQPGEPRPTAGEPPPTATQPPAAAAPPSDAGAPPAATAPTPTVVSPNIFEPF